MSILGINNAFPVSRKLEFCVIIDLLPYQGFADSMEASVASC